MRRCRDLYLIGQSGTGKSNFMLDLARQEIAAGDGLAFIDPHGDTARQLLDLIPAKRVRNVVYLDPAKQLHHLQERVGHYGVFHGRHCQTETYPRVRDFIRAQR